LTNKNVIAQFGIVLCYFLFFHLTGQALSPPGRGDSSSAQSISPPSGDGIKGRGKERSIFMLRGAPEGHGDLTAGATAGKLINQ
jgi:hypothetical protein